jgi:hypothetical protein
VDLGAGLDVLEKIEISCPCPRVHPGGGGAAAQQPPLPP